MMATFLIKIQYNHTKSLDLPSTHIFSTLLKGGGEYSVTNIGTDGRGGDDYLRI